MPVVGSQRPITWARLHVVGGQIGKRPAPFVLVLHPYQPGSTGGQARVAAAAGLNAGLLIGANHELPLAQRFVLEHAGVQIQRHGRFGREVGISREDP